MKFVFVIVAAACLAACTRPAAPTAGAEEPVAGPPGVFVQLFEWPWLDVAAECEAFLGPAGYTAVQVSPAQEHIPGPAWWTRYQPVSYRLESRGGTREEFAEMLRRCAAAGVDVYADAIINHMATVGEGSGVAGSTYAEYEYPVPYGYDDFHHCGRNGNGHIANYQDLWEVQNCELSGLADLATGKPQVQAKIARYLDDLLALGVAGLRIDAAKHMAHEDVTAILALLDREAHIYQEVIDRGSEPINARNYLPNGFVTEFKFPMTIAEAFLDGELTRLADIPTNPWFLPADKAVVFVDNHDIQRGHGGDEPALNYTDSPLYELAVLYMLASPYGYPMVMSGYAFEDGDQGPPGTRPVDPTTGACNDGWMCEHRYPLFANMVELRRVAGDAPQTDWESPRPDVASFGRGGKAHVVINAGAEPVALAVTTGMAEGRYCNVALAPSGDADCADHVVAIAAGGRLEATIAPHSAIAVHTGRRAD
jgi:alpha-amylase